MLQTRIDRAFQKPRVEMAPARLRALTHTQAYPYHRRHTVEMAPARLRALTHHMVSATNCETVKVEMAPARLRALTHTLIIVVFSKDRK